MKFRPSLMLLIRSLCDIAVGSQALRNFGFEHLFSEALSSVPTCSSKGSNVDMGTFIVSSPSNGMVVRRSPRPKLYKNPRPSSCLEDYRSSKAHSHQLGQPSNRPAFTRGALPSGYSCPNPYRCPNRVRV